jgi:hypothetical protein
MAKSSLIGAIMPKLAGGGKPRLERGLMPSWTTSKTVRAGLSVSGHSKFTEFGTFVAKRLPPPDDWCSVSQPAHRSQGIPDTGGGGRQKQ